MKKNVLILMCDQFRGDCLSFKGHPDVKTPTLDHLAAQGVSFDHAYSACPSCIPARAAFLTGLNQKNHGRVGYQDGVDWTYKQTLPAVFSSHGYQTHCVGKMHTHPVRNRCGFESLELHDGYLDAYRSLSIPHYMHQSVSDDYLHMLKNTLGSHADVTATGINCNSFVASAWPFSADLHPTHWVSDRSIRFLETRDRTKPFLLMASFVRPHPPFDAPSSYFDLYRDKTSSSFAAGSWNDPDLTQRYGRHYNSIYGSSDEILKKQAQEGYFACITHVDHQINRILQALQEDGSLEDTLIVFTSDHGEMLFDHNYFRKALPYQGSIHIPLIFRIGKNIHSAQGRRFSPVELMDIFPTLLDFAGIDLPPSLDGTSLKDEIIHHTPIERSFIHGEHSFIDKLSSQFIVSKNYKYIWFSETNTEQFFDLKNDPQETTDLIHSKELVDIIHAHRSHLIDVLADREEGYSDGKQLLPNKIPKTTLSHILSSSHH